jgi:hypothetical protein
MNNIALHLGHRVRGQGPEKAAPSESALQPPPETEVIGY